MKFLFSFLLSIMFLTGKNLIDCFFVVDIGEKLATNFYRNRI
jgi:hypothetical protein